MLVVDVYALALIYLLDFLQQVLIDGFDSVEPHYVVRVQRSDCDVLAGLDAVALPDCESGSVRDDVRAVAAFAPDYDLSFIVSPDADGLYFAVLFADLGDTLRLPGFEKFFDSRETLCDIRARDAAAVERSQRELRTRFAD